MSVVIDIDDFVMLIQRANKISGLERMAILDEAREQLQAFDKGEIDELLKIIQQWPRSMLKLLVNIGMTKNFRSRFMKWYREERMNKIE